MPVLYRKGLIIRPHPAVCCIAAMSAAIEIGDLELLECIGGHRFSLGFDVDVVKPRGVQPEDICLVFLGELLVSELLAELVCDLESS